MMKRYITILSGLFIAFLFFGSCTKKQQPATLFSDLIGQWKKTAYATDDNNNGIIDPGEIHPDVSGIEDLLVFNSDTAGYEKLLENNVELEAPSLLTWYVSGDSVIVAYHAHLTISYYVYSVNAKSLVLYTNTTTGLAAYYYSK